MTLPSSRSVSQLNMLQRCGIQYEFRYVKGMKAPPGTALIRGRSVDEAVSMNYDQKIESRVDLPVDQMQDCAAQSVDSLFSEDVHLVGREAGMGKAKVQGVIKDTAVGLTGTYREKISPEIQPVTVQAKMTADLEDDSLLPFVGIVDLIDEELIIHDTKTAGKKPADDVAAKSQQLTTYSLLYRLQTGMKEKALQLDTVIQTSAGNRSTNIQRTTRNEDQMASLVHRFQKAEDAIRKGVFIPTNPDNWWCSSSWCGYYDICPFGGGKQ